MTFDDDEGEKSELVRIVEDSFARLVNAMFAWFDTLGEVCVCVWLFVCCVCVCVWTRWGCRAVIDCFSNFFLK